MTSTIFGKGRPPSSSLYNNERLIERLGHRTPMRSLSVDPRTRPGHCRKASPEYVCLRDHTSEGHIRNVCVDLSRREARVDQEALHIPDIYARFYQLSRGRMPKHVGSYSSLQASLLPGFHN